MERKKILIIGMFDSIHLARWLKQFENEKVDFTLFPSKKFKVINPELSKLVKSKKFAKFCLVWPYRLNVIAGYVDFFLMKVGNIFDYDYRKIMLNQILAKNNFDFVHALEIQGAGYLYSEMPENIIGQNKLILTNWGSDIYFFSRDKNHNKKISKVIEMAAYYSAECERDYDLLKNYNFTGAKLPCIPNGGGFDEADINSYKSLASDRTLILCKGYGGLFGQAQLIIPTIDKVLMEFSNITAFFYSVTADIENLIIPLKNKYGNRVNYSKVSNSLNRQKLLNLFSEARVYIGCSKSDAISTSFLESLVYGAYPIQTNTSCASEWIRKGAHATLVGLESNEIDSAIYSALTNNDLVNTAQIYNLMVAKKYLPGKLISKTAKVFYSL
jgi:hypothetical protein